jgi:hypothetical protein
MEAVFNSINSFSVDEDKVSEFPAKRRVKLDCGEDGVRYASVVSAIFTTTTIVTIDEDVVTTNLTEVWYSVVKPGQEGNLPDHFHTNTEGDGGHIEPPPLDFISLTDTPSTYSGTEGYFAKSTGSGVEWVAANLDVEGSLWFNGTDSPPDQELGEQNSFYLNTVTNDIYKKNLPTYSTTSVFIGGIASASSTYSSWVPSQVVDGNTSTNWYAYSDEDEWWQYDLGAGNETQILKIVLYPVWNRLKDFNFLGSNNGTDWTILLEGVCSSNPSTFEFENSTKYRYYRLHIINDLYTETAYTGIKELYCYTVTEFDWQLITNVGGASTFVDLTDTPSTYSGGQYLRTTSSGIESIDGIIMKAPNESEWLIQVTNSGTLYTTAI